MSGQSDENHDFTSSLKFCTNGPFPVTFSPADEPDDRNCDSPREVRKPVATMSLMIFAFKERKKSHSHNTSRSKSKHVTSILCVCVCTFVRVHVCLRTGWDWEAAEEASPQSDFPGWRSILHQQETERRMAQPLEDGGGRETGICSYSNMEAFIFFGVKSE